jgi:hypothetical protein
MYGKTYLAALVLVLGGAGSLQAAGTPADEDKFAGLWQYIDANTKDVVTSVLILPKGRCTEYGPHHVLEHANFCKCQNNVLTWCRTNKGMKEFALLTGKVKWLNETTFSFTIQETGFKKMYSGNPNLDRYNRVPGATWEFARRLALGSAKDKLPNSLAGTWQCRDDAGKIAATIELKPDGPCKTKDSDLLSGVNCFRYEHGILTLENAAPQLTAMVLAGIVEWDNQNQFHLEILFVPHTLAHGSKLTWTRQ